MKKQSSELYGIIGLGRFGFALAKSLAEAGKEVIVVDWNESKIKDATAFTDNAFAVKEINRDVLIESGIKNCDTAVVCIGEKIDTSVLTTLTLIELGIKRVISKAISPEHGNVLEKLGAEVVYPERDMAERLAKRLTSSKIMEYISLSDEIDITEMLLTEKTDGKTVKELDLRPKYGLNIIAINHTGIIDTDIRADTQLHTDDVIVVCGKQKNIERLESDI
ncbi:MAG: TrkA family potassium uptake protein [Oscillospiraceae bacterium]